MMPISTDALHYRTLLFIISIDKFNEVLLDNTLSLLWGEKYQRDDHVIWWPDWDEGEVSFLKGQIGD